MRIFELTPNTSHKSFYKKAFVHVDDDGTEFLQSYMTIVASKLADGTIRRHWGGWSATTGRHLRAWQGIDKKQWDSMEVMKG